MSIRLSFALMLSLVLGLVSGTMAVARVHAAGMTEVTICSGYGVVTLTLDAKGNPTGPVHPCPDCLSGMGLAVLPQISPIPLPALRAVPVLQVSLTFIAPEGAVLAQARGPPVLV